MSDQRRPEDDDRPGDRGRDRRDDDYRDRVRDYDAGPRGRDRYDDDRGGRDDYRGSRRRESYDDRQDRYEREPRYRDAPPAGAYGHPQAQPGPYGGPAYGAAPHAGPYPPRPYYPPRRAKSKAPLIVSLCAGFAYAMFFTLYFTGTLDRMIGRVVHFPAAMAGKWCLESNNATDSDTFTLSGSRMEWVQVAAGVPTVGTSIARSVVADVYALQSKRTGKTLHNRLLLENPNRLSVSTITKTDGTPGDGSVGYYNRCG